MISFTKLDLPDTDTIKLGDVDSYYGNSLLKEGWTLAGLIETRLDTDKEVKVYGVYRMNKDQALVAALNRAKEAEEMRDKAKTSAADFERQLKDVTARLVAVQATLSPDPKKAE